jgi:ABC-2 type transport system ATP-binding protein
MTDPGNAIEIHALAKRFGRKAVLQDLELVVPLGQTFAFLGRNGAGKTTTIKMLLGLLKPDSGEIRVLGLDPAADALEIRRRVGYLAEDQAMFGWMRVGQMLSFLAPFYPTWDPDWAKTLTDRFELPLTTRIRHLSKGQNVRLGLLLALAHRPRLVILDDPTLGLDPIMRKEFLRDLVTYLQGDGITVFFSSHLLYEVEPVADAVAILDHGRIVRHAPTETLREQVKRLVLPADAADLLRTVPGILDIRQGQRELAVVVEDVARALPTLQSAGITPQIIDLNLDEIFEAYVIGKRDVRGEQNHDPQPDLERVA